MHRHRPGKFRGLFMRLQRPFKHILFIFGKNWYYVTDLILRRSGGSKLAAIPGDEAMAEIVQLAQYREQSALRDGFHLLRCRFNQDFDACTCFADLAPEILYHLALPDDSTTQLLYGMILGFQGFGAAATFDAVDPHIQKDVVDLHLFISDQVRFEMMYRLGWLGHVPGRDLPIFAMIRDSDYAQSHCQQNPPQLSSDHPDFHSYRALIERDQQVFIRRLMPAALEAFEKAYRS
jgi:hypothetical protein